jgi:hypothetical protein
MRPVEQMLDPHRRVAAEQLPYVKDALQRQIEAIDWQIDQLVYQFYGPTDTEIGIVAEG